MLCSWSGWLFGRKHCISRKQLNYCRLLRILHSRSQSLTYTPVRCPISHRFITLTGSHWHRRLLSACERGWTLTWVMDLIWWSSNTTRHLLRMSTTGLLQVSGELWSQQTFAFVTNPSLAFSQYDWRNKVCGQLDISVWCGCVCVNHSAIWQHKPVTSEYLRCEMRGLIVWNHYLELLLWRASEWKFTH